MKKTIFVTNFPDETTQEDLEPIFKKYGDIESIEFGKDEKRDIRYAFVEMGAEKTATKARNQLNGTRLGEKYLAVTPADVGDRDKLSSKQRKVFEAIAKELEETDETPLRQLEAIVMLCGTNFAEAILKETNEIEEAGGIMTSDGERRRTKGGVFFYLARFRMPQELRAVVYNRKGKLPDPNAQDETQDQAQANSQNGTGAPAESEAG